MTYVKWGIDNYNKMLFTIQMADSPLIDVKLKQKVDSRLHEYSELYQQAIDQGLMKKLPIDAVTHLFYQNMVSTVNYLMKFKFLFGFKKIV